MQLNVTTDYAIRIILYLAIKKKKLPHRKRSVRRWGFLKIVF